MISAFGVDHGEISKREPTRKDRAEHYGRMSAATGTLGATALGVGTGAGAVGALESRGKDPMGFTHRSMYDIRDNKPAVSGARKARILGKYAKAHGFQAKTLGGVGAASTALSAAYHRKKKQELSKSDRSRRASDAGLAAGSVATGATTMKYGPRFANAMRRDAMNVGRQSMDANDAINNNLQGFRKLSAKKAKEAKSLRSMGRRVAGIKGAGAGALVTAAGAGGVGVAELGRYHLKGRKK